MGDLAKGNRAIGLDSLIGELERRGKLTVVGGESYVAGLVDGVVPDRTSIEDYAEIVREKWMLRQLCHLGESLCARASEPQTQLRLLLSETDERFKELHFEAEEKARRERLRNLHIAPGSLIAELERFFAERASLPDGAALVLALWVMNTWTFDVFDTTPYLLLESAVPQCGKTTVLDLLREVCRESISTSSASEAALFRLIEASHPSLLVDEAEILAGKTERSDALRSILNAGYKRSGKALRCDGESHNPRLFDTYCPKAMASIGGLRGALLDRCIVLTMRRRPPHVQLKSSRSQQVRRAAGPLREQLEACALRVRGELARMYENEPDSGYWAQFPDREGELWGPLLYHARVAGDGVESRALDVALRLSGAKADLQSQNKSFALARELLEALLLWPLEKFSPGDLLLSLRDAEAWGEVLAGKKDDKEQAAAIGRFIARFRLASRERPHGKTLYRTAEAIEKIRAGLPPAPASAASATTAAAPLDMRFPDTADRGGQISHLSPTPQGAAATEIRSWSSSAADAAPTADTIGGGMHGASLDPCYMCRTSNWWRRSDGDMVCGTCHPPTVRATHRSTITTDPEGGTGNPTPNETRN